MKKMPAAAWILIAMVLGIVIGYMIFISFPDKKTAAQIAGYVSLVSDVFLRLIKMLIGPLVFSTLVVGIAHMGDAASVGRVFGKALGWFITASLVSLVLGLVMANWLQPGHNLGLPLPDTQVKIVDADTGLVPLPPGEVGELIVKGPQVMLGYWNNPEATAQTMGN